MLRPLDCAGGVRDGTAGIGIYLLELHDALRGVDLPDDLSPISR